MANLKHYPLIISIFFVFAAKLLLAFFPSFDIDMGTWLAWAGRLSSLGLSEFYSDNVWTQYTPGFMYYLWGIGKMGLINELAVKIPSIVADIGVGLLIWHVVKKIDKKIAFIAFFLYTLNPVVVFDSSVWGQIDGLLTLFIFISAFFLIERKNLALSLFFWSVAFLIKPQAIAVTPVFVLAVLLKKFNLKQIVLGGFTLVSTLLIGSAPFFVSNPILGLPTWIIKMGDYYSFTSVFAFNIWSWVGFWLPDGTVFAGLTFSVWGVVLYTSSILLTLVVFRKKLDSKANYYLLFAVLSLSFFLFPTRVHERYLFPFFAFLLTAAGLSKSNNLFIVYVVTSVASFLNIYYPYAYYNKNFLFSQSLYNISESLAKIIGFVFFVSYLILHRWEKIRDIKLFDFKKGKKITTTLPGAPVSKKSAKIILSLILFFAFVSRFYSLGSPPNEYFDEVYHAFTAKVVLHGDPKAWEWWNTPPEGFAYEWTHPPLAKLGMTAGMIIFGENSFGYRLPGALLGLGAVFLVYLLAREIFKDETVALLSAGVFALDGLTLVMSRIGMNDSYLLFFSLLSIYLLMTKRDFFAALSFGLAIASKWSAIWAIPIMGLVYLRRHPLKEHPIKVLKTFFWFLLLPFTVYLLSYLPMFLTGHDLSVWWEMQKQMWWYHTGLRATHPYTSEWWSWPLLMRPIYLYTSEEINGLVSRIYAFGNPLVFWFGLASVVLGFIHSYTEKNKNLALVIFSYLIFFVPWAASPRIMFLYHYLPSIPFMAIATGYLLRRNPKLIAYFIVPGVLLFLYFYPHWAGLQIPVWLDKSYYWMPNWR